MRSAWHGPGDVSPVGHACNLHLDLAIHNFGIQESQNFRDTTREVYPGASTINEAPGFGGALNEELAKSFPYPEGPGYWRSCGRRMERASDREHTETSKAHLDPAVAGG